MATQLDQLSEVLHTQQDAKVQRIVEDHFGAQGTPIFQVLFEGAVFVMNADNRLDTFPQYPGVELAGSCFSHLALKDQADPVWTTQVEIIPDQGFDQSPALFGILEELVKWETIHYDAFVKQQQMLQEEYWQEAGFEPF